MRVPFRSLALNAICLYIAAYLLTIVLHEMGHAAMSWALGGRPILYSTSVENTNKGLSEAVRVLVAAAGPGLSLLQGLLLLFLARRNRATGLGALFGLYMGVFGPINFLGYLMIAPVVTGGDTGQIVALLHIPAGLTWLTAGLALVLLVRAIGSTGALFGRFLPAASTHDEVATKTQGLRGLILWPWLVGSVVLVLLALPAPHPAVVANMFMSPIVLRRAYVNGLQMPLESPATAGQALQQFSWVSAAATVALAIGFRALSHGIAL